MVPLRLHLKNFLSYRGAVSIDFSGLGLACLSGDNGSGKSAILDAMTWAVWGESRAARDVDLISHGESETEVTFEFHMGAREYRVMRRRTHSRPTLEFDARSPGSENWLPIGGDSVRDTQARVVAELKLDYETFANSAFLRQGQADLFTQNKPGDRKRILAEILDLSGYDHLVDAARSELRSRRNRLAEIQARLGRIDLQLATRHEKEASLAELDDQIRSAEEKIATVQSTLEALRDRLTSAEMAESMLKRTNERLTRIKQQAAETEKKQTSVHSALQSLNNIVAVEETIVQNVEVRRIWRKRGDELAAALAARQPLQTRIQELERLVRETTAALDQQAALLRLNCDNFAAQLKQFEERKAESRKLKSELQRCHKELEQLDPTRETLEELQESASQLQGDNAVLRSQMNDIQARIQALGSGDATCPVCRRPLKEGDHAHIHEEWSVEGKERGDKFRAQSTALREIKANIAKTKQKIDHLNQLARSTAGIQSRVQQLDLELGKESAVEAALTNARQELATIETSLTDASFLPDERAKLQELRRSLDDIPYDENTHAEAQRKSRGLEDAEHEFQALQRAKSDITHHQAQLAELASQMISITQELRDAERDAEELAKSLAGIEEVRSQHDQLTHEFKNLTASLAKMERQRGSFRRQIEELDELNEEHSKLSTESGALANEVDAYNELTTAFGRNGIQAMVIENVLPELEDEANRILSRMSTKQLEVRFNTMRQAVTSDTTIETLDIVIRDEFGERPYQLFSGGEAFRINFAIRVALSQLLARRAGASVETLIVDEGFGTQDGHGRDGLIEAIQSVTRDFRLVLVITHVDELRYQFPSRLEVQKTDAGSRVTLI